jgi:low temperature requirement protein LtrA
LAAETPDRSSRLSAVFRDKDEVTPLELFFDLVFVLGFTQCTALMAAQPTVEGVVKGLLVLGVLWWAWVGYAWLTSVVDPEEGAVRLVMFGAMAALLIVALCVPDAFDEHALAFALAYGVVRAAHIALFSIASRNDANFRHSVVTLARSTAIAVGLLVGASFLDGVPQGALWTIALLLDMGGPYLFGAEGWKLVAGHFSERHGLIVIVALGESIVAIGVGSEAGVTLGVGTAAVLGMALLAAMWWAYFDVVALVAERRLESIPPGREQNELARDSYSYLHYPMVAGIVLVALGLKKTLGEVGDPLKTIPAVALLGGVALYLLAHVAFRLRNVRTLSGRRLVVAAAYLVLIPVALQLPALATLAAAASLFCGLIAYEAIRFADSRAGIRNRYAPGRSSA